MKRSIAAVTIVLLAGLATYWWPRAEAASPPRTATVDVAKSSPASRTVRAVVDRWHQRAVQPTRLLREAPQVAALSVSGTVTRNGRPVARREVVCAGKDSDPPQTATTATDGTFAFRVTPGTYELAVRRAWIEPSLLFAGTEALPAVSTVVKVIDTDLAFDLALPAGAIVVHTFDSVTRAPIDGAVLTWMPPFPDSSPPGPGLRLPMPGSAPAISVASDATDFATDTGGRARIDDVAPGTHLLSAKRRGYQTAIIKVEVRAAMATAELALDPVGALDVVLVDRQNNPLPMPAARSVIVRNAPSGREVKASVPDDPTNKHALRFDALEPGTHEVCLRPDRVYTQGRRSIRFRAHETDATRTVQILAGRVARVTIPVRARAWVILRAQQDDGGPVKGSIRVERIDPAGGTSLVLPQGYGTKPVPHFRGYLAPGTYSIVFRHGDRRWSESVVVDRADIARTFTLPW